MKASFSIFIIFFLLVTGCSSWKTTLVSEGSRTDAIKNAITDFMHTCYLRKKDSIFSIRIYIDNKDLIGLSISGTDDDKLYPRPQDKIDSLSAYFPNDYILKNDKLLYWWDDSVANYITKDMVSVLTRYNHIDSMNVDSIIGMPVYFNEKKKGAHYYFCKNDLRNYRKVVTNKAMGWYVPPKLKCSSLSQKKKIEMKNRY